MKTCGFFIVFLILDMDKGIFKMDIKIFAEYIDGKALDQFYSAMKQDYVVKGALMPDAHAGYSLPIGAAVATECVVVPAWVGYDIGCGMCAVKTSFIKDDVASNSKKIFDQIYRDVPVGFSINSKNSEVNLDIKDLSKEAADIAEEKNWLKAAGSLGGGNHFIEIGYAEDMSVWIVIHSGSRGVGHGIAAHYMRVASGTPKPREGHFGLRTDSLEGQAYINDLAWGLDYALINRKTMISRVINAISRYCEGEGEWDTLINRNHNHAVLRDGLWIHRKGATHAEAGMDGVIPGNMRDGSFIVKGKGNPDALYSSSHGAGRVLGRRKAKETLDINDFKDVMNGVTAMVTEKTLDESPFAYKDIFEVMRLQNELVEVVHHVRPMINIKG